MSVDDGCWSIDNMHFSKHVSFIHGQLVGTSISQIRIVVAGDAGSGKSTFVNSMLKYPQAPIAKRGPANERGSDRILEYDEPTCPYPIVNMVDTPGFSGASDFKKVKATVQEHIRKIKARDTPILTLSPNKIAPVKPEPSLLTTTTVVLMFLKCGNRFESAHKEMIRMFLAENLPVLLVIGMARNVRYQSEIMRDFSNCPTAWLLYSNQNVYSPNFEPEGIEDVVKAVCQLAKQSTKGDDEDDDNLAAKLGRVTVLLCGDSGSGKSTLINEVFGIPLASTSEVTPGTQMITEYPRPEDTTRSPLRLIDTKGFEINDFQKILKTLKDYVTAKSKSKNKDDHLDVVYYCIKDDHLVDKMHYDVFEFFKKQNILVIIVQTQCTSSEPERREFTRFLHEQFGVPVIPVLAVIDGDHKPFGLDQLVDVTLQVLPDDKKNSFTAVQQCNLKTKVHQSIAMVVSASGAAAATSAVPIPLANIPLLIGTVAVMLGGISALFGVKVELRFLAAILTRVIIGTATVVGGRELFSNLLKFIPVVGTTAGIAIQAVTGAALTLALGIEYTRILYVLHKANHGTIDHAKVERMLTDSLPQTTGLLSTNAYGRLLNCHDRITDSIVDGRPVLELIDLGEEAMESGVDNVAFDNDNISTL